MALPLLDPERVLGAIAVRRIQPFDEQAVIALENARLYQEIRAAYENLARDEEERRRLETRLRQAAKMEAVGRLASAIAHEFNNVLGSILGYGEMLVERTPEGSAERRYAQNVLTAAKRASALVEQILTYSRSQHRRRGPVDLGGIVAETLELVRGSLSAGTELQATLPAKSLHVMTDPTQIHQIVMNLCT